MSTRILLIGAYSNMGESILLALPDKKYDVRDLDIENETTRKQNLKLPQIGQFEII